MTLAEQLLREPVARRLAIWLEKRMVPALKKQMEKKTTRRGVRGSFKSNPIATGKTRDSLKPKVRIKSDVITGEVVGAKSVRYAIQGRGPGTPPPVGVIAAWATAKGITNANPYAIAKSIGRRGTAKPAPNFAQKAFKRQLPSLARAIDKAGEEASVALLETTASTLTAAKNGRRKSN